MNTQQPVLDPQCPHVLEEARYWVTVTQKRTRRDRSQLTVGASMQVQATGNLMNGLTGDLPTPATAPTGTFSKEAMQQMLAAGGKSTSTGDLA